MCSCARRSSSTVSYVSRNSRAHRRWNTCSLLLAMHKVRASGSKLRLRRAKWQGQLGFEAAASVLDHRGTTPVTRKGLPTGSRNETASGLPLAISAAEIAVSSHETILNDAPSSGFAAAHTMSDQGEPNAKDMSKVNTRPNCRKNMKRRFWLAIRQVKQRVAVLASVHDHHHSLLVTGPTGRPTGRPRGSLNKTAVPKAAGPPPPTPGPPSAFTQLRRDQFDSHGMRVDGEPARDHKLD